MFGRVGSRPCRPNQHLDKSAIRDAPGESVTRYVSGCADPFSDTSIRILEHAWQNTRPQNRQWLFACSDLHPYTYGSNDGAYCCNVPAVSSVEPNCETDCGVPFA